MYELGGDAVRRFVQISEGRHHLIAVSTCSAAVVVDLCTSLIKLSCGWSAS